MEGSISDSPAFTNGQHQVMRYSCNTCSNHKVRCTKERPQCKRCISRGLRCSYSVSRRNGRQVKEQATSQPGLDLNHLVPGTLNASSRDSPRQDTDVEEFEFGVSFTGLSDICDPPSAVMPSFNGIQRQIFGSSVACSQSLLDDTSLWMGANTLSSGMMPTSHHAQSASASELDSHHDCISLALDLIRKTHSPSSRCVARPPETNDCNRPTSCSSYDSGGVEVKIRTADQVLVTNREIALTLYRVLRCSCSEPRTLAMLCSVVIERVLALYQAAIQSCDDQNSRSGQQPRSEPGGPFGRVIPQPMVMGQYQVDKSMQRSIFGALVMGELKTHVLPALEQFWHRFCEANETMGAANSVNCFRSLHAQLEEQLHGVTKEIMDSDVAIVAC